MKYLLDTNILLMFTLDDDRLKSLHRDIIISEDNRIFTSIASFWEIGIKHSLGKLELSVSLAELFDIIENKTGIETVPVKKEHILKLESLPYLHRDPFDRLIYVQSIIEEMEFIYTDAIFDKYKIQ
ncbi:MAG: PIN domain nuclease [Spirochaetae bacterium HGW-Spirochaetae-5]|nr:MAG: PIN domain nuclease [Spirochaetae bacterium HGW-Spirochaetae-5]